MSASTPGAASSATKKPAAKQREWMPMFWDGMSLSAWLRLLRRNRFHLPWQSWYLVPLLIVFTTFHSLLRRWQWIVVGWRVPKKLEHPPLFILGHWRSGTTLLHELLVLDARHTYPTTYECFAPNHFLISEGIATRFLNFLVPPRRPMDNMPAGWQRPQEEEFALCNLGVPSPYLTIAFPNEPPQYPEYFTLEGLEPAALDRWKRVFVRLLREINFFRDKKRIILKSPPHTCRLKVLLELFPDARFVHIVRDPFVIFPSTVHLWKRLYATQGLQKPTFAGLEEYVFQNLLRMYERFEVDRELIPPGHLCELRYEDLVADPVGNMRQVYERLELGGFEQALPALEAYVAGTRNYETNKYQLAPELRDQIAHCWARYIERYGYTTQPTIAPTASEPAETVRAGNAEQR